MPVEDGTVSVLFDTRGRLPSLYTTAAPAVENAGAEQLAFAHVDSGETRTWTLAWRVEALYDVPSEVQRGKRYTTDALCRDVFKTEETVHRFDVFGTISSNATPGSAADSPSNPPVPQPTPRVRITSSAGTVDTDRDGNFKIAGVNVPVDLTVRYFGPFTDINTEAGADYSITF